MKQKQIMKITITLIAFLILQVATYAQLPTSADVLPSGFTVVDERNFGGATMIITAKKPNENFPKPHMDQSIGLEISWTKQPMAGKILEMLIKQPDDPAGRNPGSATREERCGKHRYLDGILSCRKVISPWIGGGKGLDLMTWRISWTGKSHGGLVSISLNNFYGAKETAMNWIDSIIPKIKEGK